MEKGVFGKVLWVDLSNETFKEEKLSNDVYRQSFKTLNQETFKYTQNAEYLRSEITEIGINDFINFIRTSYNAGFKKEVRLIVEKALELTTKEERKDLLDFSSEIMC